MRTFAARVILAVVLSVIVVFPASATLNEFFSATGELTLSVDAAGSNSASHIAQVNKPSAGATVRAAYVMAATTCCSTAPIPDGAITIANGSNITGITWTTSITGPLPNASHLADVTSFVKPIVDAAGAGLIDFTFTEANTGGIDGEILVVVFDDPAQPASSTIVLMFGAQATTGDTFAITLGSPINPATPGVFLDMGLGISYSFQPGGQVSIIDVNSARLTSSAGGQDDGGGFNGGLITAGGLGDTNANPADPNLSSSPDSLYDDELYSLLPFITSSTTSINVLTQNPSNDDNIMFAYFHLSGTAVIGEGILLSPETATNVLGANHTVTATVLNAQGQPNAGVVVTFNVISGPNAGDTGQATTNASGQATFTYTGDGGLGTDQIRASFVTGQLTRTSNTVTKTWSGDGPALTITKTASTDEAEVGQSFGYTITVHNGGNQSATGVTVTDDIPDGLQLLDADPSQGTCAGTSNVACNLGTLAAGATATVELTVRATDSTETDNVAIVDSNQTSPQSTPLGAAGVTLTPSTIPIPTATEYGLMLMAALLALAGAFAIRMR